MSVVLLVLLATGCGTAAEGDRVLPTTAPIAAAEVTVEPEVAQEPISDPTTAPETAPPAAPTPTASPPPMTDAREGSGAAQEAATNVDPLAPNGRRAPVAPTSPDALAAAIVETETGIVAGGLDAAAARELGHRHQVAIRTLGYRPEWDADVLNALPPELVERTVLHLSARRALIEMHSGYDAADFIPAWRIVEPEPAEVLRGHYEAAEAATGIEWEYLAAINLIETGMGRIRGVSSAGAQGPMQFLPTTWDEPGIGAGDINDAGDAIAAAARYLVRRGGPGDMPGAIWGYNNSDNYVTAVRTWAELLRQHPESQLLLHHWEIYFATDAGDVWLPPGLVVEETTDLWRFLDENPWAVPDPGLAPALAAPGPTFAEERYCVAITRLTGALAEGGIEAYDAQLEVVRQVAPPADHVMWDRFRTLSAEFSYDVFNPATDELERALPAIEATCPSLPFVVVNDEGRLVDVADS